MSDGLVALVIGTILAVAALAFVLYPLFFTVAERPPRRDRGPRAADDSAIRALREIEFDRATGKLSDADYAQLRKSYGDEALRELRRGTEPTAAEHDPIEARIRAYREARRDCSTCGLRPEPDAVYCSTCGVYLDAACPACGAEIVESAAAFCSRCGETLGAGRAATI